MREQRLGLLSDCPVTQGATETVRRYDEHHDQTVDGEDECRRHLNNALEGVAADEQATEQEGGRDRPHRMKTSEQGGHNAVESGVPRESGGRTIGDHPMALAAEDEDRTGQPAQRPGQRERQHDGAPHRDPRIAGRIRALPDSANAESEWCPPQQHVRSKGYGNGQ